MTSRLVSNHGRPFTTSYTTRFPEYISARWPIPERWIYAALRRFHGAAAVTMVATPSLTAELASGEFEISACGPAASTPICSAPIVPIKLDLPRPIFMSVGRIAVEKNLEAFLSLDLPGTKVVIGAGPQEAELRQRFPDAKFLGLLENGKLSGHLAAADVFVFPSRTDTFGVVQLEALASGVPVAAFPVTGPKDVIANNPIGALNEDLRVACLDALNMSRQACRDYALAHSWENSARQFVGNIKQMYAGQCRPFAVAFDRCGNGEWLIRRSNISIAL